MARKRTEWGGKKGKPAKTVKKKTTRDDILSIDLGDPSEDDGEEDGEGETSPLPQEPEDETERIAKRIGIDLSTECPVCRSLEPCECVEADRSFQRRCRFKSPSDESTARCDRCDGALTCVLIPRAGTQPPFDLCHMTPVWGCVHCHGASLATVMINASKGK